MFVERENVLEFVKKNSAKEILMDFFGRFVPEYASNAEIGILITKKSFWSYHVLQTELYDRAKQSNEGVKWYSDRYFQKILDFSSFDGKTIVIVDDTMNTGIAIREFYRMMRKQCPRSIIIPMVCLLNEEYEFEKFNTDVVDKEFHSQLKVMSLAKPAAIGQMCVHETVTFHDELVSYIVDLPVLEQQEIDDTWNQNIIISKRDFERICTGNNNWTYHKCNYKLIPNKEIETGFFGYYNSFLNTKFQNFLLNAVIKVQFQEEQDDELIKVIFTPFAIMRSVKIDELETCFYYLFNDTKYKPTMKKPKDDSLFVNYYTAMYRAVVFCLSMYIGVKFVQFLSPNTPIRLHNKEQFSNEFYASMEKMFPSKENYASFDEKKFLTRLLFMPTFSEIERHFYDPFDNGDIKYITYSKEDWFAFLYEKIITTKRHMIGKKQFTSEEFENALRGKLFFENEEESKALITQILLEALNKSILSNCLQYDNRTRTILRGYRYGENSEILLPYDARVFYKGILTYYEKVGKEKYYDKLDFFYISFKTFLERSGLFDYCITERQFSFYVRYFSELPKEKIDTQIENKKYLLAEDYCENNGIINLILSKIEKFVDNLSFGKEE